VYKGTVKWFDNLSGCGVLERESGEEISIHVSAMRNSETSLISAEAEKGLKQYMR